MAFTNNRGDIETQLAEINMIPFIDIMLVLLIIFMVTAPVIQTGIEVSVPETQTVKSVSQERYVITINKEQNVYFQSEQVRVEDLPRKIRERNPDSKRQSVYLVADRSVRWEIPVAVMDTLKQGGIEDISIVTQPLEQKQR
ncbi:MAG TPA: biopolymer transporter ExbD [Terriglobia bacterium]|nr:biopolymer transporter ExbD [Terriglobia bacterium]